MKPIRIFRHVSCEGPGFLAKFLDRHGVPHELVAIDRDEPVPPSPDGVSGLVFMGGPMSANDDLTWIHAELDLIRRAADRGLPMLGHCLGGQLLAKALGGSVGPNPVKEIGWLPVDTVPDATASGWLAGIPTRFTAFHWHGETFRIPPGGSRILKSAHCRNQAFVAGNVLGFQCHVEMTEELVREWAARYADQLTNPSETVQGPEQMLEDLPSRVAESQAVAELFYRRWLSQVGG